MFWITIWYKYHDYVVAERNSSLKTHFKTFSSHLNAYFSLFLTLDLFFNFFILHSLFFLLSINEKKERKFKVLTETMNVFQGIYVHMYFPCTFLRHNKKKVLLLLERFKKCCQRVRKTSREARLQFILLWVTDRRSFDLDLDSFRGSMVLYRVRSIGVLMGFRSF